MKETPYIEKYRYHYQDKNNKLIKRWDNSPHYPILSTFPNHLHKGNQVLVCAKPELKEILLDVVKIIEGKE